MSSEDVAIEPHIKAAHPGHLQSATRRSLIRISAWAALLAVSAKITGKGRGGCDGRAGDVVG